MDDLEQARDVEGQALTPTEADVMHRSEQGQTRDQITHALHIGNSTLWKHRLHAFAKLAPGRALAGAFYMLGRRDQKRDDEGRR